MTSTWINRAIVLLGWAGVFVAGVLSYAQATNLQVPCGTAIGCMLVQQHPSSRWFDVPVAYFGVVGYLLILVTAYARQIRSSLWRPMTNAGLALAGVGALASAYLTYVSITQIQQTCSWCLASAGVMLAMLVLSAVLASRPDPDQVQDKYQATFMGAGVVLAVGLIGIVGSNMREAVDLAFANVRLTGVTVEDMLPRAAKVKGDPDAPITIIEFADVNCRACRTSYRQVQELVEVSGGKIRVAWRHLPLPEIPGHELSVFAAVISELAADKGKFWDFMDLAMAPGNDARVKTTDGLLDIAIEAGLVESEVEAVLNDPDSPQFHNVFADLNDATGKYNVTSTPTFILFAPDTPAKASGFGMLQRFLGGPPYSRFLR